MRTSSRSNTHISFKIRELQSPRINLNDILRLRHVPSLVARRCSLDRSATFPLAVLASPDEICFASAAGEIVHLMARYAD